MNLFMIEAVDDGLNYFDLLRTDLKHLNTNRNTML